MLVGPSPGFGWGWGLLQASSSWEESSGSLEETSAVQPASWPSPFYKTQKEKEIKGEGAGHGMSGGHSYCL